MFFLLIFRSACMFSCLRLPLALMLITALPGCSAVMHASRPDPVDINKFVIGQSRVSVLAELGNPRATTPDGDKSCDIYRLYTRGPGPALKGAIVAGQIVAGVLTLGLSEIVLTPVEAATKATPRTVLFCYGSDNRLAGVVEAQEAVHG
jgi:hypothetical protein